MIKIPGIKIPGIQMPEIKEQEKKYTPFSELPMKFGEGFKVDSIIKREKPASTVPGIQIKEGLQKVSEYYGIDKILAEQAIKRGKTEQLKATMVEKPDSVQAIEPFWAGVGDVISTTGYAADWISQGKKEGLVGRIAESLKGYGGELQEEFTDVRKVQSLGEFDWKDMINPTFWHQKALRTLPFALSLAPAAIAGAYAGTGIATATGMGKFGIYILGMIGAAGMSRPLESMMEAGGTYQEAKIKGMTDEEADQAAQETFVKNLSLAGMDAVEFGTMFLPTRRLGIPKSISYGGKMIATGLMELAEEVIQSKFQTESLGEEWQLNDPATKEAGVLGFSMGVLSGHVGGMYTAIREGVIDEMEETDKKEYKELVKQGLQEGKDQKTAELEALDKMAEKSSVKKAINIVIDKLKKIKPGLTIEAVTKKTIPKDLEINAKVLIDQKITKEEYTRMIREDLSSGTAQQKRDAKLTVQELRDAGFTPESFYDTAVSKQKPVETFEGYKDLSTNIVEELKGKTMISPQFIRDLTRKQGLKKAETDMVNEILNEYPSGPKISAKEFADKVKVQLLPLNIKDADTQIDDYASRRGEHYGQRYEGIALPDEIRGNVADYREFIYESPIETSAGDIHFDTENIEKYFAHVRVEDMAKEGRGPLDVEAGAIEKDDILTGDIRRIIEIQSDLFQKGQLERETAINLRQIEGDLYRDVPEEESRKKRAAYKEQREQEIEPLQPYRNIWFERIIREEIKRAAQDGKTTLLFPTGETAMKIEGMGEEIQWTSTLGLITRTEAQRHPLRLEELKVGKIIVQTRETGTWIITEVLEDGKFKAVQELHLSLRKDKIPDDVRKSVKVNNKEMFYNDAIDPESFDISGKVDKTNPIYRFYESEVYNYLKKIHPEVERITDEQGVTWFQIKIKPEEGKAPVIAFNLKPTDKELKELLSTKYVDDRIAEIKKETNPNIRQMLRFRVLEKVLDEQGIEVKGQSMAGGRIEITRNMTKKEVDMVIKHEIRHVAVKLFGRKTYDKMIKHYRGLSERQLIKIFRSKETLDRYRLSYRGVSLEDNMAEEALLWDIDNMASTNPIKIETKRIVRQLVELINRITGMLEKKINRYNLFDTMSEVFEEETTEFELSFLKRQELEKAKPRYAIKAEPLAQEARKYKSAEEFVAKQKTFYHTTKADFDIFSNKFKGETTDFQINTETGHFFVDSTKNISDFLATLKKQGKDVSGFKTIERYFDESKLINFQKEIKGRDAEVLSKVFGTESGKILKGAEAEKHIKDLLEFSTPEEQNVFYETLGDKSVREELQENGYIGFIDDFGQGVNEYVIFDPKNIKTKAQLIDFYNQATKGVERPTETRTGYGDIPETDKPYLDFLEERALRTRNAFNFNKKFELMDILFDKEDGTVMETVAHGEKTIDILKRNGYKSASDFYNQVTEKVEVVEEEIPAEVMKEFESMREGFGGDLASVIRLEGGIKISGGIGEEIKGTVPIYLQKTNGVAIDEMADQLKNYGFHFEDTNQLLEALSELKGARIKVKGKVEKPRVKPIKTKSEVIAKLKQIQMIRPKKIGVKALIEKITGIKKPEQERVTKTKEQLLKQRLREQKIGAKRAEVETRKATRKGFLIKLNNEISEIKRKQELGELKGRILNREVVRVKQLIVNYARQELDLHDRGKLLAVVKNIRKYTELEIAGKYIRKLASAKVKKTLKIQIKKELKNTKIRKQAGKPVGRFTPEVQKTLNALREASRISKGQAEAIIDLNLEKYKNEIPPESVALKNKIITMIAGMDTLSNAQLRDVLGQIREIKQTGRLTSELKKFNRQADIDIWTNKAIDVITGGKGLPKNISTIGVREMKPKELKARIKVFMGKIGKTQVEWDDIIDRLARLTKDKPGTTWLDKFTYVGKEENTVKKGNRTNMDKIREITHKTLELKNDRETVKRFQEDAVEVNLGTFENTQGQMSELIYTKAEARKVWMELQDPTLEETFTNGMFFTEDMIRTIDNFLTPQDKAFAQEQLDFYKEYYKGVNEIYRDIYGVDLPQNENYSPIAREGIDRDESIGFGEFLQEVSVRKSVTSGSLKSRVRNIKPLKKKSDVAVFEQHIAEMEHFKAWANKMRDLNAVFGDSKVRASIIREHGKGLLAMVDNFMGDFNRGGIELASRLGWLDRLRSNYSRAVLAVKASIGVKQLTSFIAYADTIPVKDFGIGVIDFWKNPVRNTGILRQSEMMKVRGKHMDRDIKTAIRSDAYGSFRKHPSFLNALMLNIQAGDQGAIFVGGWPVYRYYRKQGKSHTEALAIFENVTSRTQQSSDLSKLSSWQRAGSFAKLFTMFKSAPNMFFRRQLAVIRNMIHGRVPYSQVAKTVAIYQFLIPMLFQWVSDWFKWDKEEQLRAVILGPFNGIFIVGEMLDTSIRYAMGMRVFDSEIPIYSIVDDIGRTLKLIDKGIDPEKDITTEDVFKAIRGLAGATGSITGKPIQQPIDIGAGIIDVLSGEYGSGLGQVLGWSEYVTGGKGKKEKKGIQIPGVKIPSVKIPGIKIPGIKIKGISL